MTLDELAVGKSCVITAVGGEGETRRHFLDMGMIPGTEVTVVKYAPMGDPMELTLHGYELALRVADAKKIEIVERERTQEAPKALKHADIEHPGLGESGRFHPKGTGDPYPEGTVLRFALVGNQNSGKTTLFNRLTGSNQHVGNFPGVTVDRKDGPMRDYPDTLVTDLPGIYSMSPYTKEEVVSRSFVLDEKPHAIINIVDATNIERNLYLTLQLLEMEVPVVVALNMMDEVTANGGSVDINQMERALGCPVVPISAAKNSGVDELIEHAIHVARYKECPERRDFCGKTSMGGAVHRCIHSISHLIEDHAAAAGLPLRFAAAKVAENDPLILERLALEPNEIETIGHIIKQTEKERGLDICAALADARFAFILETCEESVKKPRESREHIRSRKIDRILTGKYTAIPLFILIMGLVFFLSFNVIGAFLQGLLEKGMDALTELAAGALEAMNVAPAVRSLVIDGIFTGVGSVISFLPIIVTMFFFLSLLEDSGYIARAAFFMDKLLRKIGLSGRSAVPLLIGFGCTVPAVMATRTMPSDRDRKMTILLTPFMSCTAKLPIYAFFVDAFFPRHRALVMMGLYLFGIAAGVLMALLYKNTLFKGEAVPFVMEMPNYRLPGAANVARLLWEKARDFLSRAFSVILIASVVIWFLQSFDTRLNFTADSSVSMLAKAAGLFVPIMKPLGLGDWRICTSLISGFMAKESVVSSLQVLFADGVANVFTPLTALTLLVFSLLYTPCVAALAAMRRELGGKWALSVAVLQCVVAWLLALAVHAVGGLIL